MYKIIEIVGGAKAMVVLPFRYKKCAGCGAEDIIWVKTLTNHKNMPVHFVEGKGFISHFADCPAVDNLRKK